MANFFARKRNWTGCVIENNPKEENISLWKNDFMDRFSVGADWRSIIETEIHKPYFSKLYTALIQLMSTTVVFPEARDIFAWTRYCRPSDVKVVILGQDPYYSFGMADGLAFSVRRGVKIPKSLETIFTTLSLDVPGFVRPNHGNLEKWAKQGVLLLNSSLTVSEGKPNSHSSIGWKEFVTHVLEYIIRTNDNVVFLLWGKHAQGILPKIHGDQLKLVTSHPSPRAGPGFHFCKHFALTNKYLEKHGIVPIDWNLD